MAIPQQWGRGPRPDQSVIELLEALQAAAKSGKLRALSVVTLNPMLEVEISHAGHADPVRRRLLSSGLIEASLALLPKSE